MHPKRSGNSGRYFRVRNWLSEYGLSSETCGRLCVLVTPKSASRKATGLELIDVPRSACSVSWPGRMFCFAGSAQEFVETRILGCFLNNDEFSLGDRHALSLEQQIAEILVTAASSKKGFDVAVDGFHHSEANFGAAVVQDAV